MTAGAQARRAIAAGNAAGAVTVHDVLDGHVALDLECLDRIYLNGYVPNLQVGGQVVTFLTGHLGHPVPSPALLGQIGDRFRAAVARFARDEHIPVVRFAKDARKADVMKPYLAAAQASGRPQVVAIGVAQEFQRVFTGYDRATTPGAVCFGFDKADRRVTCFYFYLWDSDFGPAFIKICSYFPYPIKVWVNGHEWAKQQAAQAGIAFTALSNGFASCGDTPGLQAICDRLDSGAIAVFFERWMAQLPLPFGPRERDGGYWWELSMRQIEVSRTLVFDAPRNARTFFDALVSDNLGLGRPDEISYIFDRRIRSDTQTGFATKVVTRGVDVTVNLFYKHSRIKQYLKEGRALRIETVVNSPKDLAVLRRLDHLEELQTKARAVNARLLHAERVGQGCVLASPAFERVALPSVTTDGRRAPALRFGDPRVMALAGALSILLTTVVGFTNRSLRAQVSALLGTPYSTNQMGYDLARLRRNGLIRRLEHTNTYVLTDDGQRVAISYTKVHDRLLRPLLAANTPPAPPPLRDALAVIDKSVAHYTRTARLKAG
ncbi:hypothetical protein [Streptomyces sp. CA-106131]|uniref:hypothetical protein n=1 Tax=Streptomyces sp. CA-106131 TaxID=3240045 RepID=UPI003D8E5384